MPPARRQLKALGSLQLVGYANNPASEPQPARSHHDDTEPQPLRTEVITELAFTADERAPSAVMAKGCSNDADLPLEVQFDEFMDGVNSRSRGTGTRQRKMTVEQASAILLVTVQKGHVELITKKDDSHTIDLIRILPAAKRILASFLPKLRGYGDIPYDQQYRGAIALAKRHFFPRGTVPTKKELMALLLQSYQEKRELDLQHHARSRSTKTLGIQTSLIVLPHAGRPSGESTSNAEAAVDSETMEIPDQPDPESSAEQPNDVAHDDDGLATLTFETDPNLETGDVFTEPKAELVQHATCTPVAPRSFNPYLTPMSNPRHTDHTIIVPSLLVGSPAPVIDGHDGITTGEGDSTNQDTGDLLQATATSQGRLDYYFNRFVSACHKITFLEGQKEEVERKFDVTRRKLAETEQRLREANTDRSRLKRWVDLLRFQVDSFCSQLGSLREMTNSNPFDTGEWAVYDPESQGAFDPTSM